MKWKILLPIAIVLLISALIYGFLQMRGEKGSGAEKEKPTAGQSKEEASAKQVVNLDETAQKAAGLETTALSPATLPTEIKSYGRVLDPSGLISLLSNVASAKAALDASAKDYERVKALFTQGENASAKAMETAEAATKRDQIALQAAQAQLLASWGKSFADQSDLPTLVQSLSTLQNVVARLDLPAGEMSDQTPLGARLLVAGASQTVSATFIGRPTATDPQVQGQGFLFLATNTPPRLSPGLALTGFLQMPGEPLHGVKLPEAAVVRTAELAWVYVQTGSTNFTRRELNQDHPVADGWFVTTGLQPNDRVVTTGAQTLLSEERKSEIKTGD